MKDLLKNFLIAKGIEEAARKGRIAAEEAIIAKMGNLKLEGTTTKEIGRASCRERVYHPV